MNTKLSQIFGTLSAFLFLMAGNIVSAQKTTTLPFTENFSGASTFTSLWTVVDNNNDGKTWAYDSSNKCAKYSYSSSNAGDDYLIAPAINMYQGKDYKLTYKVKAYNSNPTEKLKVKIGQGFSYTDHQNATVLKDYPNLSGGSYQTADIPFTVPADGAYNISFYSYSNANQWYISITDVSIVEVVSSPGEVTELSVVPGTDHALNATLSWKNPSVNTLGNVLVQSDFTKLEIYRNEEVSPVFTLDNPIVGNMETWTDENIPYSGKHTYKLVPYNGTNPGTIVTAYAWIGPGLSLPYTNNFSAAEFALMTVLNNNNDGETWILQSAYAECPSSSVQSDDYLFTPPLNLHGGSTYKLTFEIRGRNGLSGNAESMSVKIGKGLTAAEQDRTLADYPSILYGLSTPQEVFFSVPDDDDYFISFYAYSAPNKWYVRLQNIELVETITLPGKVTDLTATPGDNKTFTATLDWINPSLTSLGGTLSQSDLTKIEIYRNKETVPVHVCENPPIGEAVNWIDNGISTSGMYKYKVIPYNGTNAGVADSISIWIGGGLDIPYENNFSEEEFKDFTVVDANNDEKKWVWSNGKAQYKSYTAPDDWIISPALELKKGYPYLVSFGYNTEGGLYYSKQQIKLMIGTDKNVSSMTTEFADFTEMQSTFVDTKSEKLVVEEDGTYYIGIHLCSADGDYIYLNRFSVIIDPSASLDITSSAEYRKNNKGTDMETVDITANLVNWTVSTDADWITVNNGSGTGDGSFTFSCSENNGDQRNATVAVQGAGITRDFEVYQSGIGADNLQVVQDNSAIKELHVYWDAPDYNGITFNLYRDDVLIANQLTTKEYKDNEIEEKTEYCYTVGILYPNGIESALTNAECGIITIFTNLNSVSGTGITIGPNPVSGKLYISSDEPISALKVTDINGRLIQKLSINTTDYSLYTSEWINGVYLIHVITEKDIKSYKIIKK